MSDLPIGWTLQRLGDAAVLFARRVDGYLGVRPYLATSDVNQGAAAPSGEFAYSARPARADLLLKVDDVLQAKMKGTDKAFLVGNAQNGWLASTGFAQFNPQAAGNSSRFFLHVLSSRWFLGAKDALCVGSTQQAISDKELAGIVIALPPTTEQAGIADVLNSIDTAIRETEAIIAKLKVIKQALLHDLLTRGIDANGELRPPYAEAPHLYKQSPLGWIPKEWNAKPLGDLVDPHRPIVYGILMPGYGHPGGVPVVKVKDIRDGKINTQGLLLTSPQIDREYSRSRIAPGDLLFTIRGTVGRMAFVPAQLSVANITQDTARICVTTTDPRFVRHYIEMPGPSRFIATHTLGVAVQGINLGDVRRIPMAIPAFEEAKSIADEIDTIDARIEQEANAFAKLGKEKSGLMDDLLTGRVRVTPLLSAVQKAQTGSA